MQFAQRHSPRSPCEATTPPPLLARRNTPIGRAGGVTRRTRPSYANWPGPPRHRRPAPRPGIRQCARLQELGASWSHVTTMPPDCPHVEQVPRRYGVRDSGLATTASTRQFEGRAKSLRQLSGPDETVRGAVSAREVVGRAGRTASSGLGVAGGSGTVASRADQDPAHAPSGASVPNRIHESSDHLPFG